MLLGLAMFGIARLADYRHSSPYGGIECQITIWDQWAYNKLKAIEDVLRTLRVVEYIMDNFTAGNIYITIELVGFVISIGCFVTSLVLMAFFERAFIIYLKGHNYKLWEKYKNFEPGMWWRFLDFIRQIENEEDTNLKELRLRTLRCEKFAIVTILLAVAFFASMIITLIVIAQ